MKGSILIILVIFILIQVLLGFADKQVAQIQSELEKMKQEIQAIKDNQSLIERNLQLNDKEVKRLSSETDVLWRISQDIDQRLISAGITNTFMDDDEL
jgi:septal ring factor EnvC (AmiA/AmiB activator)